MLELDIAREFYIFLIAVNQGFIIGIIYDIYRAYRWVSKPIGLKTVLEDLLFWLIISGVFFIFLFNNTDGVVRGFVAIGFLLGYIIYIRLLSKYNLPLLIKFFKLILNTINEIIKMITYPFKYIGRFLTSKVNKFSTFNKTMYSDMKRYVKIISKKK